MDGFICFELPTAPALRSKAPVVATDPACRCWTREAFTLVEMLVVLAILLAVIGSSIPVIRGILSGRGVGDSVDAISGYLTNARIQAMSQNTYVVVGFYQAAGSDDLQMEAVRSLSGTFNINNFANSVSGPTTAEMSTYRALGPIIHLPNVTLTPFGNLAPALQTQVTNAGAAPNPSGQTTPADPSTVAAIVIPDTPAKLPALTTTMAFQFGSAVFNWYLIAFTPEGEALYFPQTVSSLSATANAAPTNNVPYYAKLFIGLSTSRNGVALTDDLAAAAISIDGGSGSVNVYRL